MVLRDTELLALLEQREKQETPFGGKEPDPDTRDLMDTMDPKSKKPKSKKGYKEPKNYKRR